MFFAASLLTMTSSLVLLALAPLAEHERRLADVLERALPAPLDRADDGVQVGRATASRTSLAPSALAALQRVGGDLEQRMRKADRLRPLLLRAGSRRRRPAPWRSAWSATR